MQAVQKAASPVSPEPASAVRYAVYDLAGDPGSVAAARHHTREFLQRTAAPPQFLTDALLAVSELVANAVVHAPGPCTLLLRDDGDQLAVTVRDTSAVPLTPRAPDHGGEGGGFGWHLLHRVGTHITTEYHTHGKNITVVLPRTRP